MSGFLLEDVMMTLFYLTSGLDKDFGIGSIL